MKKGLFIAVFLLSLGAGATGLPKVCLGQYDAVVPAFTFECNNKIIKASSYKVTIKLTKEDVFYQCGSLMFLGSYSDIMDEKGIVSMLVNFSNNARINFDLNLHLDKSSRMLNISGLKGVPVTRMAQRKIKLTKKS